jgi:RNA polymerase sigma-70 factor (ECF subfamily)
MTEGSCALVSTHTGCGRIKPSPRQVAAAGTRVLRNSAGGVFLLMAKFDGDAAVASSNHARAGGPWAQTRQVTMADDSDLALVSRTKAGDTEAFSELVRRHDRIVYNLAYRFMRDAALAEDMAQDAFLKAYRLLNGFRGDCSFSTWLYRVTCSVCLTELNRRKRRGEVELTPQHAADAATAPEEATDTPELIRRCVTKLPDHYAAIVTLYYLQEIPYEQIAEIMEIPMGTLKTWMHRARLQLRKIVEKEMSTHESPEPA